MFKFGDYIEGKSFRVLNERTMRGSAALVILVSVIGFVNGFILNRYGVFSILVGFVVVNFAIGIFIAPKYSPTVMISRYLVRKQTPLYVGAVQKHFAWSLGLAMSTVIFIFSLVLAQNGTHYYTAMTLCVICMSLIFLEMGFGICIGCKLYFFFRKIGWIPQPKENPNCTGDACFIPSI